MFTSLFCGGKGKGKTWKREDFRQEYLIKRIDSASVFYKPVQSLPGILPHLFPEKTKTAQQPTFEPHGLPGPFMQVKPICMPVNKTVFKLKFCMNMVDDLAASD